MIKGEQKKKINGLYFLILVLISHHRQPNITHKVLGHQHLPPLNSLSIPMHLVYRHSARSAAVPPKWRSMSSCCFAVNRQREHCCIISPVNNCSIPPAACCNARCG